MENQTEMLLSLSIIILTILAIIVYIYSGPTAVFYGIFLVALVVMFYTWRRISGTPEKAMPKQRRAPAARQKKKARKRA